MGLLESAAGSGADALGGVAGKDSMLGGLVDDIAGGLNGSGGTGGGTPNYYPRDPINDKVGAPQPLNMQSTAIGSTDSGENRIERSLPLEFIHFGKIHIDMSGTFAGKGPPGHGVGSRDALLREVMLLFGFVGSAKRVLESNTQGAIGNAIETVGSLLGSGKKSGAVGPEQFTALLVRVQTVGDTLNDTCVTYPMLHQAGVDLHTIRADFGVLCASAFKPGAGGGMGLPSLPIPGMGALGGVGGFIADIPKYLFKVQDTYKAMYQASRNEYEAAIEEACRAFSIEAIKDDRTPTYPIWFDRDEQAPEAAPAGEAEKTYADNPLGDAEKAVDDAMKAKDDALDDALDAQDSLTDWLATAGARERPGSGALGAAFAGFSGGIRWVEPRTDPKNRNKIVEAHLLMAAALAKGADISLPGFVDTVVKEIAKVSLAMLQQIYTNLLLAGGQGDIRPLVLLSVRETLSKLLVDLAFKLAGLDAPGENKKKQEGESKLGKVDVGLPELKNKGAELVRNFITEHSRHIDVIIEFIVDELSRELEAARAEGDPKPKESDPKPATPKKALTMENLLGRLPMLLALQVRNTLFPVFNLLLDAFGLGDTVGQTVWNPVRDRIKQAGQIAGEIKQKKDDVLAAGEKAKGAGKEIDDKVGELGKNNFNFLDPVGSAGEMADKVAGVKNAADQGKDDVLGTAMGAKDELLGGEGKEPPAGDAPISGPRLTDSEAVRPGQAEVESVAKVTASTEAA